MSTASPKNKSTRAYTSLVDESLYYVKNNEFEDVKFGVNLDVSEYYISEKP
jgi:hypothetical protein